jgi:hypothetical protein
MTKTLTATMSDKPCRSRRRDTGLNIFEVNLGKDEPTSLRVEHLLNIGSGHYFVVTTLLESIKTTLWAGKKYVLLDRWKNFG